jgi:glycosyltransferase involved in cell wall biosynthesis
MPAHWFQKTGRWVKSFWSIPDSKSNWKSPALKLADKIIKEHKIEVILATAPPYTNFLIGRDLSLKHNIPLVVDYRDTWTDNKFNFYPTPYHKMKAVQMEASVLNTASNITVVSRHSKELLLKRYNHLNHKDVTIIPHGYDPHDLETSELKQDDKLVILHLGSFLDSRTPKYMLKAMKNFFKKRPYAKEKLILRLVGKPRNNHKKLPKKFKLENNVEQIDYLPHSDAVNELFKAAVLWVMLNDDIRTPGKLYEYFGARKTILITAPDGNMKELAKSSKAAITTNPKNVKEIENAINSIFEKWEKGSLPIPSKEFSEKYDRRALTKQLSRILSDSIKYL